MTNLKFPIEVAQMYQRDFDNLVRIYGGDVYQKREYWDWYQNMLTHFGSFDRYFHFVHYDETDGPV